MSKTLIIGQRIVSNEPFSRKAKQVGRDATVAIVQPNSTFTSGPR
jgi:hypothetical protein